MELVTTSVKETSPVYKVVVHVQPIVSAVEQPVSTDKVTPRTAVNVAIPAQQRKFVQVVSVKRRAKPERSNVAVLAWILKPAPNTVVCVEQLAQKDKSVAEEAASTPPPTTSIAARVTKRAPQEMLVVEEAVWIYRATLITVAIVVFFAWPDEPVKKANAPVTE